MGVRTLVTDDRVGIVTRYFLRRLAKARRKKNASPWVFHWDALVATSMFFVGMPILALFSCVGISSFYWDPTFGTRWPGFSPKLTSVAITLGAIAVGGYFFGKKFKRYRTNPDACLAFDTERDRQIIFWQLFWMSVMAGLVLPSATLGLNYLMRA